MTVSSTAVRSGPFTPNGVTTTFPFTFQAASAEEIRVFRLSSDGAETDIPSGFTVIVNDSGVGSVVFNSPPIAGDPLYIESAPLFTQEYDFENQGPFLASSHEGAFDRAAKRDLWLKEQIERAALAPVGESGIALPSVAERSLKFAAWDAAGNWIATIAGIVATPLSALGQLLVTAADAAAARLTLDTPRRGVILHNLCPNSELSICTALPLRRVGTPISVTSGAALGVNSQAGQFNSAASVAGHCGGLTPGKLLLAEGPAAAITLNGISATVTTGTNASRLTSAAGSYAGVVQGSVVFIGTGGTNTSPKGQYRVNSTDSSTYIELTSIVGFGILVNETATFNLTIYPGASVIDGTMNGFPAAGRPDNYGWIGWPLKVGACSVGSFVAYSAGLNLNLNAGASRIWEATPGDDGYRTGNGPDGWFKDADLRYWRTYEYDWDGVTKVTLPGCSYGGKFRNDTAGAKRFGAELGVGTPNPLHRTSEVSLKRYRGRWITFGAHVVPPGASRVRPFIYDGATTTYGDWYAVTAFDEDNLDATFRSVTAKISKTAVNVQVGIEITGGVTDDAYGYVTQPMGVFGRELRADDYTRTRGLHVFTSHPNFGQGYVNGDVGFDRLVRIEQESAGVLPCGLAAIHIGLEGRDIKPGGLSQSFFPALLIADTAAQYIPSLTMYQPQVRSPLLLGSGAVTVAAGATDYIGASLAGVGPGNTAVSAPFDGVACAMYTRSPVGPGSSQTFTYTLRVAGVDTTITSQSTGGATVSSIDGPVSTFVSFTKGQALDVKVVTSAGAAVTRHNVSLNIFRIPDEFIVNSGIAVVGRTAEAYGSSGSDTFFVQANNGGWKGVNIDMFACDWGG